MFMNEPDFEDEFGGSPGFEYGQAFPSPDSKQRQAENRPPGNRNMNPTYDDRDADLPSFGGGAGTPQNSRARMLAQQRELQLKKRQSNMLSGGMVRSSLDSGAGASPMRQSGDSQFTPAVRQFSAPKNTAKDSSLDASPDKDSEFTKRGKPVVSVPAKQSSSRYNKNNRYSDDEEDDARAADAARRAEARHNNRDRERGGDRDRDRERDRDGPRRAGTGGGRRGQFEDDEDDFDLPEDGRRGGGNGSRASRNQRDEAYPSSSSGGNNTRGGGGGRGYVEEVDRDRRRDRDADAGGKWAGATGGRDVQQQQQQAASGGDSRYRSEVASVPAHIPTPGKNTQQAAQHAASSAPMQIVPPDLSDMRAFLTSPLPRNVGTLQCYIRRNKSGTNKLFPIYSLYLKDGDVFLMASKKRPKNKTSNYLISMDQNDLHRTGRSYLGKLRSNFMGTEFQVFDNGVNPKDTEPDEGANANSAVRCELGSVMYAANVLGSRGPRKMQVALPGLDEHQRIIQWKDTGGAGEGGGAGDAGGEDILSRMKERNMRDLVYLINKPPRWNEQVGAYVLNFNGRVTMASVKNFQLVDPDEQNAVVLQFGRVGKDEFTMDLQYPISPFQAFAVTLSSFDSKIACD